MKVKNTKNKERKLTQKDYCLQNGKFLDTEIIHDKNMNFLGNIFRD